MFASVRLSLSHSISLNILLLTFILQSVTPSLPPDISFASFCLASLLTPFYSPFLPFTVMRSTVHDATGSGGVRIDVRRPDSNCCP